MPEPTDFLVRKTNLRETRFAPADVPSPTDLAPGETLLAVDCFALTANNVTYGVFGETMGYWRFFPAPEGWGRIPVWGFAEVVASARDGVTTGERVYGYLPLGTHLVVRPEHLAPTGFADASPHRSELHAVYNHYSRTAADPLYDPANEPAQMLFRPLFTTSFLLADYEIDNAFFGARSVVVSSASAKTAFGMAHLLSRDGSRDAEIVGLTSAANRGFVEGLGCYDRVLTYDDIESLPKAPAAYVDISGSGDVRARLHRHFGDELKHDLMVGAAHWDEGGATGALTGVEPTFFFAPTQAEKRRRDWGAGGFEERFAEAWHGFMRVAGEWIEVVRGSSPSEIERVYQETLDGRARPDVGYILSLRD